jgi:hypothetical protein
MNTMRIEEATSTVTLSASKTYEHRTSTFQRVTADGKPVVGVLQIDEARKPGLKVRSRRYCVSELDPGRQVDNMRGRRFKLTKPLSHFPAGPNDEHEYTCYIVPARPNEDRCGCPAGQAGNRCAHVEAIRAHGNAGNLPRTDVPVFAPKVFQEDGEGFRHFPDSPTCNPASIPEYWIKARTGERPLRCGGRQERGNVIPAGECTDDPGTGQVYTCNSYDCPTHGRRNIAYAK